MKKFDITISWTELNSVGTEIEANSLQEAIEKANEIKDTIVGRNGNLNMAENIWIDKYNSREIK